MVLGLTAVVLELWKLARLGLLDEAKLRNEDLGPVLLRLRV